MSVRDYFCLVIPAFSLLLCSIPPRFQTADKGLSLFSIRLIALRIKTCHRQLFICAVPRKRGPKATPTGGPERSERVSAAHNPKCRSTPPVVIPIFFSCHSHENGNPGQMKSLCFPWISGSSPKMTILLLPCHSRFFSFVIPAEAGIHWALKSL